MKSEPDISIKREARNEAARFASYYGPNYIGRRAKYHLKYKSAPNVLLQEAYAELAGWWFHQMSIPCSCGEFHEDQMS